MELRKIVYVSRPKRKSRRLHPVECTVTVNGVCTVSKRARFYIRAVIEKSGRIVRHEVQRSF